MLCLCNDCPETAVCKPSKTMDRANGIFRMVNGIGIGQLPGDFPALLKTLYEKVKNKFQPQEALEIIT